ncbi:ATP-binding cassette long-chain fatty acid transporter PXA1 NDAI_0E01240 [Naumovozyma dairenensis CBS 421]|uniref:ABC transporter domain-containing protein n=1 Tax=Naumovozyma dairenensis (strain ATCC 10597 / BCRC 20456 / CBS 421 / NBRC 0211 / NRRL Y-12639) TaxID=1071378 RepID=G0WB20_NAUDC|nr:hypothetical protein NDAI_0E01240 [Naumovozyma dairenensis CBS 421]CCD24940.1 hypothetical protein NDAI_0E01240 [Naumovozyma dairenensis CBS 421]
MPGRKQPLPSSDAINVREKIQQLIFSLHSHCIGLQLSNVTLKTYINALIRHLWKLVSSKNTVTTPRKRRAQVLLLSIVLSSITTISGFSYLGYQLINKLRNTVDSARNKNRYGIRRTKSQVLLGSGGRVMYIPEDDSLDVNNYNKEFDYHQEHKIKKIHIPPKDDDMYDHDKFLFKNVEQEVGKNSQIFYSKFLNQMNVLSRILIPNIFHKNSMILTLQIFFLIMRTWLSLFVARLDGQIVKDIIAGRGRRFLLDLAIWFSIALPASYTNSAIKLLQRKLSLNFRVNLTRYIHDMYLDKRLAFYKLMFDSKANSSVIKNIDNSISNDITRFSDATCSVFANIAKPIIDLVFFSVYLRDNLGTLGVAGIFLNYFTTGYILRRYTPPLGKLTSASSAADGDYYSYHLNLINNNEEIAFYQGTTVERTKVKELYDILMIRMLNVSKRKFNYNMLEDYILKYTWSGLGYVFASIPIVLTTLSTGINAEQRNMRDFIVNKRLMLSLADAGSRLMHSIKDISQLTGYTNRIFSLICALHRVHSTKFNYGAISVLKKDMLEAAAASVTATDTNTAGQLIGTGDRLAITRYQNKLQQDEIIRGTVQRNFNGIRLENIDVIIPSKAAKDGIKLIKKLTFQIPPHIDPMTSKTDSTQDFKQINDMSSIPFIHGSGSSLLILGPNSSGKTSIQRIIAEIWPIYNKNGLLSVPSQENIFCIPQRPYFTSSGTLRDQIIYPMSSDEFFDRGLKDSLLIQILKEVNLKYLMKRSKGLTYLDTVADWKDLLSGGEKQRINFARILFHKPRFIVLDEATNAISQDMEDYLFNILKKYRFNFITISQRPSLIKYHDLLLEISDHNDGTWQIQTLGTDEAITSIDHEIESLEKKLKNVNHWETERRELQKSLSVI